MSTPCPRRFSTLGPFLMVLPSPLHAGLCFRRHDFAARTVGFVGRSCQRERPRGCLWLASDPSTESRCVGSGLFFRWRSCLVDRETCPLLDARLSSLPPMRRVSAVPAEKGVPRRLAVRGCRPSQRRARHRRSFR